MYVPEIKTIFYPDIFMAICLQPMFSIIGKKAKLLDETDMNVNCLSVF